MRQLRMLLVALAATIASIVAGCGGGGGPSQAEIAHERTQLTNALSNAIVRREQVEGRKAAKRAEAACRAQVGKALDLLGSLYSGYLSVSSYGDSIDGLNRELDRVPRGSLSSKCLEVVREVEDAVGSNERTYSNFYNCVTVYIDSCNVGDADHQSLLKITESVTKDYLSSASAKLRAIGRARTKPVRPSVFLPRTESSVKGTVYGVTAEYFCGSDVRQSAVEPCQQLRDVLVDGVEEGEEESLNEALTGIAKAYGLGLPKQPTDSA